MKRGSGRLLEVENAVKSALKSLLNIVTVSLNAEAVKMRRTN